jgi:hypothetical protein
MIKHAYRIIRLTSIPLIAAGLLTLLSGFTTTKYFLLPGLGYSLSYLIHTVIIPLVFLPLFLLHSAAGTLTIMARHKSVNTKSARIGAVIAWLAVGIVFVAMYAAQAPAQGGTSAPPATSPQSPGGSGTVSLTATEIAKHDTASDCWIVIDGSVYDVTSQLLSHPGGADTITPYCGSDASQAWATKDKVDPKPHSPRAEGLIGSVYLGDVGGTSVNLTSVPGAPSKPAGLPSDDEWEDEWED